MVSIEEKIHVKTPEYVSLQFHLAGLGSRSVAFIIDQLILMAINLVIILSLFFGMEGFAVFFAVFDSPMMPLAIAVILIFAINTGYFFILEYFMGGQTIGKKISGIRVIQDNGHSITLLASFIRNLLRIIDGLPASYFLGILMIFFHSEHKRLGDLAAGTIVVHEKKRKNVNKLTPLERELSERQISKESLSLDDSAIASFGTKEWQLLKKYSDRFVQLPFDERSGLTTEVANILLVKAGISLNGRSNQELENLLLALYLRLKDDFDYEL